MRTRAVVNILRKHVPGNPMIIVQYMPAGGGRQAANHVYKVAKPDGLTIGSMGAALVANAVLGEPGVQYDIDKFIYLGTPDSAQHYLFITHRDAGLNSLEKLRADAGGAHRQPVCRPSGLHYRTNIRLFDRHDRSEFVTGYSGPQLDLAITRREVDARVTTGETMLVRSREWLDKGLVDVHAGIEIPKGKKNPRFGSLAGTGDLCQDPIARERSLEMFRAFRLAGQNFFLPPGTPKDRVQILQDAMRKTFNDPEFYKELKRSRATPRLRSGPKRWRKSFVSCRATPA